MLFATLFHLLCDKGKWTSSQIALAVLAIAHYLAIIYIVLFAKGDAQISSSIYFVRIITSNGKEITTIGSILLYFLLWWLLYGASSAINCGAFAFYGVIIGALVRKNLFKSTKFMNVVLSASGVFGFFAVGILIVLTMFHVLVI